MITEAVTAAGPYSLSAALRFAAAETCPSQQGRSADSSGSNAVQVGTPPVTLEERRRCLAHQQYPETLCGAFTQISSRRSSVPPHCQAARTFLTTFST